MAKTMTTQEVLASNCKRLRKAAGLTQTDVAKKATQHRSAISAAKASDEINQRTVGRLESTTGNPTIATIDAVAAVFSLTAWQLMIPEDVAPQGLSQVASKAKQICDIAETINDIGLKKLLPIIQDYAAMYPIKTPRQKRAKAA